MNCEKCGADKNLQLHHTNYDPPRTIILYTKCHQRLHGHDVGLALGEKHYKFENYKEEFSKLWANSMWSISEISKKFGISIVTTYNWKRKLGLNYRLRPSKTMLTLYVDPEVFTLIDEKLTPYLKQKLNKSKLSQGSVIHYCLKTVCDTIPIVPLRE